MDLVKKGYRKKPGRGGRHTGKANRSGLVNPRKRSIKTSQRKSGRKPS